MNTSQSENRFGSYTWEASAFEFFSLLFPFWRGRGTDVTICQLHQSGSLSTKSHQTTSTILFFFLIFPFFNFKYLISKDVFFSPQDFVVVFFNPCLVCSSWLFNAFKKNFKTWRFKTRFSGASPDPLEEKWYSCHFPSSLTCQLLWKHHKTIPPTLSFNILIHLF